MNKLETTRRSFLISSGAGLTSLVFADSALSVGKEAVDLLNPASPLVLPQTFLRLFGSQWSQMVEQLFTYLEWKWVNM